MTAEQRETIEQRLAETEARLDEQAAQLADISDRLARIEARLLAQLGAGRAGME